MGGRRRSGDAGSRAKVVVEGKQTTNGDEKTRARDSARPVRRRCSSQPTHSRTRVVEGEKQARF